MNVISFSVSLLFNVRGRVGGKNIIPPFPCQQSRIQFRAHPFYFSFFLSNVCACLSKSLQGLTRNVNKREFWSIWEWFSKDEALHVWRIDLLILTEPNEPNSIQNTQKIMIHHHQTYISKTVKPHLPQRTYARDPVHR